MGGRVRDDVHCLWPWPLEGGALMNGEDCAQEVREGRSGLSSVAQFPWAIFRFSEQVCSWSQIWCICQGLVRNAEATLDAFSA